jgi:hypothetical protein
VISEKIKHDEGFKKLLRGIRKTIKIEFEKTGMGKGKHHWNEEKWLERGESFLKDHWRINNVDKKDVAATVLMLYHSFGPTGNPKDEDYEEKMEICRKREIFKRIGDDGMTTFKRIFDNNSKQLVKEFFSHSLI